MEVKQAMIKKGMEQCKSHELMPDLIRSMFNYELEMEIMQGEVLSMPDRMPLVFNYMDLFFQILPNNSESSYKKMMRELCRYYDKKSCLNLKHSEVIIDVFRFCIRKDPDLSKYLEKRTVSLETIQSNTSEAAHTNLDTTTIPNPSMMEVDTQSKLDMLLNKNIVVTEF